MSEDGCLLDVERKDLACCLAPAQSLHREKSVESAAGEEEKRRRGRWVVRRLWMTQLINMESHIRNIDLPTFQAMFGRQFENCDLSKLISSEVRGSVSGEK